MRLLPVIIVLLGALLSASCGRLGYDSIVNDAGPGSDPGADSNTSGGMAGGDEDAGPTVCMGECVCTDEEGCDFECAPVMETCTLECPPTANCSIICPPNVNCDLLCGRDKCFDRTGSSGSFGTCRMGACGSTPL